MTYRVSDVSPDLPFGTVAERSNTGGRILTVACDPQNPSILYAASEYSGVWKSTDAGRQWRQSSEGLRTGCSLTTPPVLAVNPRSPEQLLYTTALLDWRQSESGRGRCASGGTHLATSTEYHLHNAPSPAPDEVSGWRWCRKCQVLFHALTPRSAPNECAGGGVHEVTGSGNYALPLSDPRSALGGWRTCRRCRALYTRGLSAGQCPADSTGGPHDSEPAVQFAAPVTPAAERQRGWRQCSLCQALFFGGISLGGLYVSRSGAALWEHVDLPDAPVGPVAFATRLGIRGHGLVLTTAGVMLSVDADLRDWRLVPNPIPSPGTAAIIPLRLASLEETVVVDSGRQLYRSTMSALLAAVVAPTGRSPWQNARERGLQLPDGASCEALCVEPEPRIASLSTGADISHRVLVMHSSDAASRCAGTGGPHSTPAEAAEYAVLRGEDSPKAAQPGWRWCCRCYGLFFIGNGLSATRCPAGGQHDPTGSSEYFMAMATASVAPENVWRWCRNCQGLFHPFRIATTTCPAGGGPHVMDGSGAYMLAENALAAPGQHGWQWCSICHGLYYRGLEITIMDFDAGTQQNLNFSQARMMSGTVALAAGHRQSSPLSRQPGVSYDIVAGNGNRFFRFQPSSRWELIPEVHMDTWSIAFAGDYDPTDGRTHVYLAHDGGVSTQEPENAWVTAMSGLHGYKSTIMAGVEVGDQATLYVPSGDNGCWYSTTSGVPGTSWQLIADLGDQACARVDSGGLVGQVAHARNQFFRVYRSSEPLRRPAVNSDSWYDAQTRLLNPQLTADLPPFVQVLSLRGEAVTEQGDYIAVNNGVISRSTDGGRTWNALSRGYANGVVDSLAASGGHRDTVVYFTINHDLPTGRVRQLIRIRTTEPVDSSSREVAIAGTLVPDSPFDPQNVLCSPIDPSIVYVSDMASGRIMSLGSDGSWRPEDELTRIATNEGEFAFARWDIPGYTGTMTPLRDMLFTRFDRNLQVALLFPGAIVVGRRNGSQMRWKRIDQALEGSDDLLNVKALEQLLAFPMSGFIARLGASYRLFVALLTRGVIAIDDPFAEV